ncbi:MAG: hypothetical protein WCK58_07055 [Chloroflexota bacterium]
MRRSHLTSLLGGLLVVAVLAPTVAMAAPTPTPGTAAAPAAAVS